MNTVIEKENELTKKLTHFLSKMNEMKNWAESERNRQFFLNEISQLIMSYLALVKARQNEPAHPDSSSHLVERLFPILKTPKSTHTAPMQKSELSHFLSGTPFENLAKTSQFQDKIADMLEGAAEEDAYFSKLDAQEEENESDYLDDVIIHEAGNNADENNYFDHFNNAPAQPEPLAAEEEDYFSKMDAQEKENNDEDKNDYPDDVIINDDAPAHPPRATVVPSRKPKPLLMTQEALLKEYMDVKKEPKLVGNKVPLHAVIQAAAVFHDAELCRSLASEHSSKELAKAVQQPIKVSPTFAKPDTKLSMPIISAQQKKVDFFLNAVPTEKVMEYLKENNLQPSVPLFGRAIQEGNKDVLSHLTQNTQVLQNAVGSAFTYFIMHPDLMEDENQFESQAANLAWTLIQRLIPDIVEIQSGKKVLTEEEKELRLEAFAAFKKVAQNYEPSENTRQVKDKYLQAVNKAEQTFKNLAKVDNDNDRGHASMPRMGR